MHFTFLRATTKDVFALHCEQGRLVPMQPNTTDKALAETSPGFLEYRDNGGPGISDAGVKWWMRFYNVPAAQWPAGIT